MLGTPLTQSGSLHNAQHNEEEEYDSIGRDTCGEIYNGMEPIGTSA